MLVKNNLHILGRGNDELSEHKVLEEILDMNKQIAPSQPIKYFAECMRTQKIIEKIGKSKFIKANIRSSNLELLSKTTWETFLLEFNKAVETDDDNNGDGDIDMELDE
ncbi:1224_t:CDS:2 [Entrophospora sp. SA101]|nr:1224_t:CDS:2 [Entrophospora sp. SA101]